MTSSNGNILRVTGALCGIQRSPVKSTHKGQWRGALVFSLIYAWMNDWIGLDLFNDDIRRQAITWTKPVQDILAVLEWTIE